MKASNDEHRVFGFSRRELRKGANSACWFFSSVVLLGLAPIPLLGQTNALPEFELSAAREYLQAICRTVQVQAGTNAESLYIQARLQNQLGRSDEAERLAREALALDPSRADIHVLLAEMFVRKERMEEARESLQKAVELNPRVKGVYGKLGMVLERLGRPEDALAAFIAAAKEFPDDAFARLLLGRALVDRGKPQEAIPHLERACQLDPTTGNAFYALYQAQTRLGMTEPAKQSLARFQQLKQKERGMLDANEALYDNEKEMRSYSAGFHVEVATVLMREGKQTFAEEHLRQACRIAPYEPKAFELLGDYLVSKRRWPEAKEAFATLVRLRPQDPKCGATLGTVLLQLKNFAAGEAELKRVLALEPGEPEALHNLASYYLSKRQNLPEALDMAQRLADRLPTARSYDLLGWACYSNGRTNEALAAAAQAVQKEPTNAVYLERHRRLQAISGATR